MEKHLSVTLKSALTPQLVSLYTHKEGKDSQIPVVVPALPLHVMLFCAAQLSVWFTIPLLLTRKLKHT